VGTAIAGKALSGCLEGGTHVYHVFFMAPDNNNILKQKLAALPFSDDFKTVAAKLGFETLEDISNIHVAALIELEGFTYHILQEFVQLMQQNNLTQYIKQH
jgi:hypothetical protein